MKSEEVPQLKSLSPGQRLSFYVSIDESLFFLYCLFTTVCLLTLSCSPLLFCWQVAGRFRFGCCTCRDAHSSPVHLTLSGAQVRERYEGCCRRSRKNLTDGIWKMNMFNLIHLAPWVWCNDFCVWYQEPLQSYVLISIDVRCCWWKPIWGQMAI